MNKQPFFIVGKHAVMEALKNPKRKVLRIFLTEESKKNIHRENPNINLLNNSKVYFKTKKELDRYTGKENILHQGYVAEVEHLEEITLKNFINDKTNLTLACFDEVSDPRNIGSIVRSAVAFNIDGLIFKDRHFPDDSKLMYKAASGAMEYINIFKVPNINTTLKNLKESNFWVYSFDNNSKDDLHSFKFDKRKILLFGSEGFGIREKTKHYADFKIKIKINSKIESLNVSNSVSIVFNHVDKNK